LPDPSNELARLRERPENEHLLGGFGPLLVGLVLVVLMVVLAPTIAPEQEVQVPVHQSKQTTFTTVAPSSTTTTVAGAVSTTTAAP
jgi:hypothetical protein